MVHKILAVGIQRCDTEVTGWAVMLEGVGPREISRADFDELIGRIWTQHRADAPQPTDFDELLTEIAKLLRDHDHWIGVDQPS